MYDYDDRFDCDPGDCNVGASMTGTEFDTDAEASIDNDILGNRAIDGNAEDSEAADDFGVDFDPSDETAAVDDYSHIGSYGTSDDGTTGDTDLSELYVSADVQDETSDDCGCGCGNGDGCGCGYGKDGRDNDTESADDVFLDPSDEMAATSDSWNDCDECATTCAQKKCALDDYEIISDVLGCEKQLVKLYSTALCESAEEPLRDIFKENLIEAAADQFATFEFMEKRGMYNTEQADEQQIVQAKEQFCPLCD